MASTVPALESVVYSVPLAEVAQVVSSTGLDHWGRYLDEFGVVDGEWLITRRTITTEGVDPDGWAARLGAADPE